MKEYCGLCIWNLDSSQETLKSPCFQESEQYALGIIYMKNMGCAKGSSAVHEFVL